MAQPKPSRATETKMSATFINGSTQVVSSDRGEWEIVVCRHPTVETFTFDVHMPQCHVSLMGDVGRAASCHNMTRDDLVEHVARCQAALAVVPDAR
jgi:hypothetical protein